MIDDVRPASGGQTGCEAAKVWHSCRPPQQRAWQHSPLKAMAQPASRLCSADKKTDWQLVRIQTLPASQHTVHWCNAG